MDFEVKWNEKRIGSLSYKNLATFRHHCLSNGYFFDWNTKEATCYVSPSTKGKRICIVKKDDDCSFIHTIINRIEEFVSPANIDVYHSETTTDDELQFTFYPLTYNSYITWPNIFISYNLKEAQADLFKSFVNDLHSLGMKNVFAKKLSSIPSTSSLLIRLEIPQKDKKNDHEELVEALAASISEFTFHYFTNRNKLNPSSMVINPIKSFLENLQDITISENPQPKLEAPAQPERREIVQTVEPQQISNEVDYEDFDEAHSYFDYTVHLTTDEEDLNITGNFYITNTGNTELKNPIVCLKVDPKEHVSLGGQILPPSMAEVYGVQSSGGLKGWRYLEDDWFDKAKDRGEYWIAPLHSTVIKPGEQIDISNFQLSIAKPKEIDKVTVKGIVFFKEQDLSFTANNAISISLS